MRKILTALLFSVIILNYIQCAGTKKTDPEAEKLACRNECGTAYDSCIEKALKNRAKKAACEAVKNKCISDCNKI